MQCGRVLKNATAILENESLAAVLSSDLTNSSVKEGELAGHIQYLRNQTSDLPPLLSELRMNISSERLHVFGAYCN